MTKLGVIIGFFLADLANAYANTNFTVHCFRLQDTLKLKVIQGEALHLPCPNLQCSYETNDSLITWFKNGSDGTQKITTEESARVHHHGPDLYILPLTLNDTGLYITHWWWMELNEMGCYELETDIVVYEELHTDQLYLISETTQTVLMYCPVCEKQNVKKFTWYKDFSLIPGKDEEHLYVYNSSKKDDGIYTCLCSWEHHGKIYNTSGSQQLQIKERVISFPPRILHPVNNSIKLIDLGSKVVLKCSVFFGINMRKQCFVFWERNHTLLDGVEGYIMHDGYVEGIFESYLTISKASEADLQSEFRCIAQNPNRWVYVIITLRTRETVLPLVVMFLCIFLIFVLAVGAAKWFAIDLALLIRGSGIIRSKREDGKVYDAYVIYQKDVDDKTEKILAHFINEVLPAVLENSCGFKLYIHGRDDLPGEDCTELIERRMQLSRRLIVVLTSGTSQRQGAMTQQGYDWKLGLHQVLVQQEMSMILIQLGDMNDYSHLPLSLQHILQKTSPLKWNERSHQASSPSSRFWKKVRYMMPCVPAELCHPESPSPKFHCQEYSSTQV